MSGRSQYFKEISSACEDFLSARLSGFVPGFCMIRVFLCVENGNIKGSNGLIT